MQFTLIFYNNTCLNAINTIFKGGKNWFSLGELQKQILCSLWFLFDYQFNAVESAVGNLHALA